MHWGLRLVIGKSFRTVPSSTVPAEPQDISRRRCFKEVSEVLSKENAKDNY